MSRERVFQRSTVGSDTPSSSAMSLRRRPSPDHSTIRPRVAMSAGTSLLFTNSRNYKSLTTTGGRSPTASIMAVFRALRMGKPLARIRDRTDPAERGLLGGGQGRGTCDRMVAPACRPAVVR